MTSKLSKTIMFALAVVLVAAPLVFAQQSDRPGSSSSGMGAGTPGSATDRPSTSPGMSGSGTTGSTPGMQSPSTGTMGAQLLKGQRLMRLVGKSYPPLRVGKQMIETVAQHYRQYIKDDLTIAR